MSGMPVIYKCDKCGKVIIITSPGEGKLVCCDQDMRLIEAKKADFKTEKHVPIIEKSAGGIKVTVGSTIHPMTEEHHIEWIAVLDGDIFMAKCLKPGDEPVAEFPTSNTSVKAFEYCNIHEFWSNEK